jgi:hypothetical protein
VGVRADAAVTGSVLFHYQDMVAIEYACNAINLHGTGARRVTMTGCRPGPGGGGGGAGLTFRLWDDANGSGTAAETRRSWPGPGAEMLTDALQCCRVLEQLEITGLVDVLRSFMLLFCS